MKSIFNFGKVCIFSRFKAKILLDGKPVKNAKVIRITNFSKKEFEEKYTDENGFVDFPSKFKRSILNILPQEFTVGQEVDIIVNDKEYTIWSGVKRSTWENAEGNGKEIDLLCELNNREKLYTILRQSFYVRGVWDVEEDEFEDIF